MRYINLHLHYITLHQKHREWKTVVAGIKHCHWLQNRKEWRNWIAQRARHGEDEVYRLR